MNETPTLSILIVNWNTPELLAQCLESVVESGAAIIVVDNASTDGSAAMLRARFPAVQLIESDKNLGFAGGNNLALRHLQANGRGDFILLLNPDTVVRPGALQALTQFMAAHPQCGAAGARLLNADGSLQISCHPFPTLFREIWRLFHLDWLYPLSCYPQSKWQTNSPQSVDSVQGAALLLRPEALSQAGLFDEAYFMYSEEVDLCQRLKSLGWEVYWLPGAEVVHYGGQSTRQVERAMFLQLYRSKLTYFRVRHGQASARRYKLVLLLAALPRLLLYPLPRHRRLAAHYAHLLRSLPGL